MSSIGVKLAKKANVPVVPLALKTDALKNGKVIKDIGQLETSLPVYFSFGEPFQVAGKGNEEQKLLTDYIGKSIREWSLKSQLAD